MYVSILAATGPVAESNCQSMCMCTCFQHWTPSAFVDRHFLYHLVTTISTQIHFSSYFQAYQHTHCVHKIRALSTGYSILALPEHSQDLVFLGYLGCNLGENY